ncbi:MAG: putative DNA modification/repair radical SAM protein [Peptostreptococcaceae bacterium]|nr:putative DNA modification/repair radical SAM protein [Peptostreptococcaceae bacterium]
MSKSLEDKLRILSDSAKYDVSCSSSGSQRKNTKDGIGNAHKSGICHSWSSDGRCISLLKILMTNHCIYDCEYCINRRSNDIERATLTPDEIVRLTINFYRRNYIEGLFLSSGILKDPDHTMERLIQIARRLRMVEKFNGYIHMKVIPGASAELIYTLGMYVDRVSVNIEMADNQSLQLLAPDKKVSDIVRSMNCVHERQIQRAHEQKLIKSTPAFVPAGQTTQMIVGAGGENDYTILSKSEYLYKSFDLKRVYYSAYVPVNKRGLLAQHKAGSPLREHRLYQADWLLRFYKFEAKELLSEKQPFFDVLLDPKANWAVNNLHLFPMEINKASYEELLRIPGLGVTSALRIIKARKHGKLKYEHLKKIGVVLKRAKYFITVDGEFYGYRKDDAGYIRDQLQDNSFLEGKQMSFFDEGNILESDRLSMKLLQGGSNDRLLV